MTMRMEAPEEPGRRDQSLDAGAEALMAVFRLGRVALMHDPSNQAFLRQLEQTHQALVDYCARAGRFFSALFTPAATFVGGELLRAPRATQEAAAELGAMLDARNVAEISISKDVSPEDLLDFTRFITQGASFNNGRIRVGGLDELAKNRGLVVEHLPIDQHIARTYGEAVVAMRRLFDELLGGRYVLPPRIKRIAHALVDLAAGQNPFFVGVTETQHAQPDEAVRAVHAGFLAAAMAREIGATRDKSVDIVLAALLHDVALPRIRARAVEQTGRTGEEPEADTELPAGTAATLATFGGLHEAGMPRMVMAFESQWDRFSGALGTIYRAARPVTLASRIVSIAHDWTRLRTQQGEGRVRSIDDAVAALLEDRQDASELVVARLLVATLRFYPVGTVVELDSGEIAEVVRSGNVGFGTPVVRITIDRNSVTMSRPLEVDLADERVAPRRAIVRVRSVEGWRRLERSTTPHESPPRPRMPEVAEQHRASLPSISPTTLEALNRGSESDEMISMLRTELSDQLSDVLPRDKSWPSLEEITNTKLSQLRATEAAASAPPRPSGPGTPNAKGTLGTTPLVHVLIYALDHGVTGSIELKEPGDVSHLIYVRKGAPVKVKSGRLLAPIGEVLAQAGKLALDKVPELAAGAERAGILFGEHAIAQGLISRGQLWSALELQIPLKLERLTNLPAETAYALYRDVNMLEKFGGADAVAADPIHVIHSVVRNWHDRARIRATLGRIAKHPIILRADAKIGGMKLSPEERAILEAMRNERAPLAVLSHMRLADVETLNALIYTLAITRQLDLPSQKKKDPMGVRTASLPPPPVRHTAPPSSASRRASGESAGPKIAEAIANALSAPPPPQSGAAPTAMPLAPAAPELPAPLTATASPVSSGHVPPVSSSRERLADSQRRGHVPSSASVPAAQPAVSPMAKTMNQPGAQHEALDAADRALAAMASFRQAEAALTKGDYASAERLAAAARDLDPEPIDYRAMITWIRAQSTPNDSLGPIVGAMTDLLVEHPDHPRVLLYRARLLKRQGRVREAVADYETHLRINPKSKEATTELKALKGG